jgi:hypothetical protein
MPFWINTGQVNPDGEMNQMMWWATQGMATFGQWTENQSYNQTWMVTQPGMAWPSKSDAIRNPQQQLQQLDILKDQFKFNVAWSKNGNLMIQTKRVATPLVNDNIRRMINTWVPANKPAWSWVWLPEDLWLSIRDVSDSINTMQTYLQHMASNNRTDLANELSWALQKAQEDFILAQNTGNQEATQEALAQLKIITGRAADRVWGYLFSMTQKGLLGQDAVRDMQMIYGIRDKWWEFEWFVNADWQSLQRYIQSTLTPEIRTETAPAKSIPSRMAKQGLRNNRRYWQMAQSAYSNNPAALKQLMLDSSSPTITQNEKSFIRTITPQITAIQNAKEAYAQTNWRDAAEEKYSIYKDLIDIKYKPNKSMMDDIMGNVRNNIMGSTPTFNFINLE